MANRVACANICMYCDMPLSDKHDHDHFPIPQRHGGEAVVCACKNCHSLKDRKNVETLVMSETFKWGEDWRSTTPMMRIVFAKMFALMLDLKAERVSGESGV